MAFKMKGPSLYQNGAFGKNLNVQKDYAGQADGRATSSPFQQKEGEKQKDKEKPKLNQFGETPETLTKTLGKNLEVKLAINIKLTRRILKLKRRKRNKRLRIDIKTNKTWGIK